MGGQWNPPALSVRSRHAALPQLVSAPPLPLGAVAFCFALVGTVDMAGNMWFDGFDGPWSADVAPVAILAGGSGMLVIGGFSTGGPGLGAGRDQE